MHAEKSALYLTSVSPEVLGTDTQVIPLEFHVLIIEMAVDFGFYLRICSLAYGILPTFIKNY
jgi:hypothetical protein